MVLEKYGDKTFLASMGLGIDYPDYKLSLILGSIAGMVASDSIAIFLGRWLGSKMPSNLIDFISNCIFIIFGIIGLFMIF